MDLLVLKIDRSTLKIILREVWQGKSLARSFMNVSLMSEKLKGDCLDLGSKSSAASYNRFLQKEAGIKRTYTDFHQSDEDIVRLDLENNFSIDSNKYKTITCFNVLEHIYNHKNLINESYRVLSDGGEFIGGIPFLVNYHADPHDYFRYTDEAIKKLFEDAGFKLKKITFLGYGPLTAGLAQFLHIFPRVLQLVLVLKVFLFDYLILKYKKSQRKRYPLGYTFVFTK